MLRLLIASAVAVAVLSGTALAQNPPQNEERRDPLVQDICQEARLSNQERIDCRAQVSAASTDSQRAAVRAKFKAAVAERKAGVPASQSTPKTDGHTSTVTEPERIPPPAR
jgi:hypothetical protein